jgi:hypothetical protein
LQLARSLTHGEAPDLGILKYTPLQSFQYKNELLLLRELKKPFVILASIALAFVHYSYSRVHNSWDEVFFKIMKKPSIAQRLEGPL